MKNRFALSLVILTIIAGLVVAPKQARANPHIWIDYNFEAMGSLGGIKQIKFYWLFDPLNSPMLRDNFRISDVGTKEINLLYRDAFENLKQYHYFINMVIDGKDYFPTEVSKFFVELTGQGLRYSFIIPMPHPAQRVDFILFDPTYYVDIGPAVGADQMKSGAQAQALMKPSSKFMKMVADNSGTKPKCTSQQSTPRVSQIWGKFATFLVTCYAQ